MKAAKREEQPTNQYNRSTSRYSINRICHAKSPDNAPEKSLKPSNSFLDLRSNKQNIDVNHRHHQNNHFCASTTPRQQLTRRQHQHQPNTSSIINTRDCIEKPCHGYNQQDEMLIESRKRLCAQVNEKDMIIMQMKNSIRKAELEAKKRDKVIADYEKIVESKHKTIVSLTAQNSSLSSAIELLKMQQVHSTASQQSAVNECVSIKRQLITKTAENKKLEEQLSKAHKDIQIYNSLEPRLKELEELQDCLIEENQRAKDDRQLLLSTLRNIERIIRSSSEPTAEFRQIQTLISGFLN